MKTRLPFAQNYMDLIVYQKTCALTRQIFRLSQHFPIEERFALTDQLRRASRSIGAQIAEAWAKRRYPKHFVSKLSDADGERLETEHWLRAARDCGYVREEMTEECMAACTEIGRMLAGMMNQPGKFCDRAPACDDTHTVHQSSS